MKTLQREEMHPSGRETFADAVARLPRFLEGCATLGDSTPRSAT